MAIYNAGLTGIDLCEIRRYAGLSRCTDFSDELLDKACNEAQLLAVPQGSWQVYPYNGETAAILSPQPLLLIGGSIKKHLLQAAYVAVMAVTIGLKVEDAVTKAFKDNNYTDGLLLDAAATAAVETVADQVNQLIAQTAQRNGYRTLTRFSPGYGDWDISVQRNILALADGAAIGIRVNAAAMLIPRKSITAVIGFVPNAFMFTEQSLPQQAPCTGCNQENCLSRREEL